MQNLISKHCLHLGGFYKNKTSDVDGSSHKRAQVAAMRT